MEGIFPEGKKSVDRIDVISLLLQMSQNYTIFGFIGCPWCSEMGTSLP